ncbi:TPA: murein biosynthesis integral membrane protein MurJ [Candidatus Sumerlaeota bacterium]|nr:murein biosynthesis integral membrane protein MurJ [Candidatus Sumerlaeota bacterium]
MAANLLCRILGLLRETVISKWFGQNGLTDVYTAAFRIPDFLFFLLAGGVFSAAFIPVFSKYMTEGKEDDAWEVFSTVTTFLTLTVAVLVVLGEIFADKLIPLLVAPGFTAEKLQQTAHLTRIILPGQISFFLGGVFIAVLNVRGEFLTLALGPNIYNLAIIAGGFLLRRWIGIEGLCWGVLVGAVVGNFLLPVYSLRKSGARYRFSLNLRHPGVRQVGALALPVLLGLSLPQAFAIINTWFASSLQDGVVTALERANKIMQAPLGIVGQAISVAIFPTLAALAARGDQEGLRKTFSRGLKTLWFLTIPIACIMIPLAHDIVAILLQYGKFTGANTDLTAEILVCFSIGLFAFSSQALLNRAFYAVRDTITPVLIGTGSTILFIALNFALRGPFQHRGIALAGSLAAMVHAAWMLFVLRRRTGIYVEGLVPALIKTLVAAFVGGVAAWIARALAQDNLPVSATWSIALTGLIAGGLAGAGVYIAAAKALKCEELNEAWTLVQRRLRRKA